MIVAAFTYWDDAHLTGIARSSDGQEYPLHYCDGQSWYVDQEHPLPQLTGHHEQPDSGQLKVPTVGDPVLIEVSDTLRFQRHHWAYLRHYLELVERQFGTEFLTTA